MTKDERKTLAKLVEALGIDDPRPIHVVAKDAGLDDTGTCPRLRAILRKGTIELGLPIVAGPKGFYLTRYNSDLDAYALGLFGRAFEIQKHADAVRQLGRLVLRDPRMATRIEENGGEA